MSTNSKCNACNVVINELLSFVADKIKVMDQESIVLICKQHFTTAEIVRAKTILYETVPTDKRMVNRRADQKNQRDMEDIVSLIKDADPSAVPVYVARELTRLPPVTFDHVDVTRLLKDIVLLKSNFEQIQRTCVNHEQLEEVRSELKSLRGQREIPSAFKIKNPALIFEQDIANSGPTGLNLTETQNVNLTSTDSITEKTCPTKENLPPKTALHIPTVSTKQLTNSYAAMAVKPATAAQKQEQSPEEGFTVVTRRRRKKNLVGTSTNPAAMKLKVATPTLHVYVSGFDRTVTPNEISEYIKESGESSLNVELLPEREGIDNNAFKLTVSKESFDKLVNVTLWPPGINVGIYKPHLYNAYRRNTAEHTKKPIHKRA